MARRLLGGLSVLLLLAAFVPLAWLCLDQVLDDRRAVDARTAGAGFLGREERLSDLALSRFDGARTDAQYADATRTAREALRIGPMQNSALLVLALDADRRGRKAEAARLMRQLGGRTHRDIQVQLWLGEQALAQGRYADGFLHMDMALRRDLDLSPVLFPMLAAALDDPSAAKTLASRLALAPNWRSPFLSAVADGPRGADRAARLLGALRSSGASLTGPEAEDLLKPLLDDGRYGQARVLWKALLPAAGQGDPLLYDGTFAGRPGPPPFNWRLRQDGGAYSEIARSGDGAPALHVQSSLPGEQVLAEQLLTLPAGTYRLSWSAQASAGSALQWVIACADADSGRAATGELPDTDQWRSSSMTFEVRGQDCSAQWLRLVARSQLDAADREAWIGPVRLVAGG